MPGLSANQEQQLTELVAKGDKIAAIKLYRVMAGVGLREAKEAVEAIMRGTPVNIPALAQVGEPGSFLENRIKRLLAERNMIEAVKVYREAYNCGLKEAKDAVDLIRAEMRQDGYSSLLPTPAISNDPFAEDTLRNRSCLVLVLALLVVGLGGLVFFFLMGNGF